MPDRLLSEAEVLISREGRAGRLVLNRPAALNSLNDGMVRAIAGALDEWEHDDRIETVVISGAGERAFCAGGDITMLYEDARSDARTGGGRAAEFWAAEYALNARIARYPKPYVAIMDRIVLGGGVGVSAHGSVRVVTERSRVGMPETGIGFVPDVGGTWLLAQAPGELGTHLALTAGSATGADSVALGFADFFVPSARIPSLLDALRSLPATDAVRAVATDPPASELLASRDWIDRCYASDDASEIVARLQADPEPDAQAAAAAILTKSPLAVSVALAALRRARELPDLEAALAQEFRVSVRFAAGTEFVEGVRAQVIDKDRTPHWSPATLAEVDPATVESYFASLGDDELALTSTKESGLG